MAKRQGPRPTVRISRDAGSTSSGATPTDRRPIRRQTAPEVARRVDRSVPKGRSTPLEGGAQANIAYPVALEAGHSPLIPGSSSPRPPIRAYGKRTSPLPQAATFGERIGTLPSSLTVPGRATIAPPADSADRTLAPLVARSGATRTREAGLRLFGDYSYVKRDLRRIAVLTISALVLLVVVSFLLPLWLK